MACTNGAAATILAAFVSLSAAEASTLPVDGGWIYDRVDNIGALSIDSPISFTLTRPGTFSLTDAFAPGDVYRIRGDIAGVTTFALPTVAVPLGRGDTDFDAYFYDPAYSRLQASLGAGTYTITVIGDGAGGIPAGFGLRVDQSPVPLPPAAPLFGAALLGLAAARSRSRAGRTPRSA